ncbi:Endochitinase [Rhynchospora pubera]|uniref:chitinase n=1 Tax=Rhynchospora pubera TaxID=906938 RepID=A0AAV8AQH9_9POAL|nr:Endochitinase [Rhynchospora pubera]KAJ4802915.1 Endochitinase [Rhynchospora pubera]
MRSTLIPILTLALLVGLFFYAGKAQNVNSIITPSLYNKMLPHRNQFYTYDAFIKAANAFPQFGTTGDAATRKKELAAFFGQTSHETTGGWPNAPDGPYAWGYSFIEEQKKTDPPYYGRGPIQLTHKYNYEQAAKSPAIKADLINNPNLVSSDPVIAFKTAIWFWMTPQSAKPSCHDVMTGKWTPSASDKVAGRLPGYGLTTNIINGGEECNKGEIASVTDRIGFYKRYCNMLGVSYGDNIDCKKQKPYNA